MAVVKIGERDDDINCRFVDPFRILRWLTYEIPDDYVGPISWCASEVAIAVFSCSVSSLTYLFRRVIGSKYSDSWMPYATADNTSGATCQGEHVYTHDNSSFRRLRDDDDRPDHLALAPTSENFAVNVVGSPHDDKVSHELDRIVIKSEFDIERSTSGRL